MLNSCNKHEGVYMWEGEGGCSVCALIEYCQKLDDESTELARRLEICEDAE